MSDEAAQGARLSGEDVEAYFKAGFPARRKVLSAPETYLEFDPVQEEIRLLTPAVEAGPDLSGFERISVEVVDQLGHGEWAELCVDAQEARYEAYLVLAAVVDLMRTGLSFAEAILESMDSFRDLLKRKLKLTDDAQTGLFGELLLAEHALERLPAEQIVNAWLGPANEEHDYAFDGFDAEVKTTRGEARVHLISSVTQLEATFQRPLYLLSVQVTAAGAARGGRTLGELIGSVRDRLNPQLLRIFDSRLGQLGWRDVDSDNYPKRWVLRSSPRAYLVGEKFPAITTSRLQRTVPRPELVAGVQYRIDVTNLEASYPPAPLNSFVEPGAKG